MHGMTRAKRRAELTTMEVSTIIMKKAPGSMPSIEKIVLVFRLQLFQRITF